MSSAPTPATPQDRPTPGVALKAVIPGQEQLLPPGVLALLVSLHRAIEPERQARLAARQARQAEFDAGALPDFRADTREIRDRFFDFLSGWLGGPQRFIEKHGHPRLRARHLPFSIGKNERDQWLHCMNLALDDTPMDAELRAYLKDAFAKTGDFLRNRGES